MKFILDYILYIYYYSSHYVYRYLSHHPWWQNVYAASAARVVSRQRQGPPSHDCQCQSLFRGGDRSDAAWRCDTRRRLEHLGTIQDAITLKQGLSFGAVWTVYHVARRLGIEKALGTTREGKLALWQVIARVIDQGSRLSAVRLAMSHAACDVLGLGPFDEDALYENLDWLAGRPSRGRGHDSLPSAPQTKPVSLFLYDVTSSYLEGTQNELAAFGYNRDGKKGKRADCHRLTLRRGRASGLHRSVSRQYPRSHAPLLRSLRRSRPGLASPRSPSLATGA